MKKSHYGQQQGYEKRTKIDKFERPQNQSRLVNLEEPPQLIE